MLTVVTGGAGFIGINLVARLLDEGGGVAVVDDFSGGSRVALAPVSGCDRMMVVEADMSDRGAADRAFDAIARAGQVSAVWHLAANSDIGRGVADPDLDLRRTFLTTHECLRQARRLKIARVCFASSSAVYGDHGDRRLSEEDGPLLPISNYGAMKLASEASLAAATEAFLDEAVIFRFPNVVGAPATHGVIFDFISRLHADPNVLEVRGDGTQRKPYLHVSELLDAMLLAAAAPLRGPRIYNIGPADDGVDVRWIAERVVERVSPAARINFGSGPKGWTGDIPRFRYATERISALGWRPSLSSEEAVVRAIEEIATQIGS
jgi:UDP-glucose 4-epimerase